MYEWYIMLSQYYRTWKFQLIRVKIRCYPVDIVKEKIEPLFISYNKK